MTKTIAKMIDHTLLKADAKKADVAKLIAEAKEYGFASVCIQPYWVKMAAEELANDPATKVCTVIGFPLGANTKEMKAAEAENAIQNGADEVDMVMNIGALKSGASDVVAADIQAVTAVSRNKALVKVIIETSLLTEGEKQIACQLAVEAGADYVKTSTGFSTGGATIEDVKLMREAVGLGVGVKASGGVKSLEDANRMIEAGATRIGASSGIAIVNATVEE